jgi:hypothetical protein
MTAMAKVFGFVPHERLFDCIQDLAQHSSNPVLEVLQGVSQVEQERKYPEHGLAFAGNGVRAFYHCHVAASRPANEHGHFHLFLHAGGEPAARQNWTHLAGLSMDRLGQPLRWFTVNRWVTDGRWLSAAKLMALLQQDRPTTGLLLVETWLLAMLAVYRHELELLLTTRDQIVMQLMTNPNDSAFLEDRRHYELSTCAIDLLTKFQQHE